MGSKIEISSSCNRIDGWGNLHFFRIDLFPTIAENNLFALSLVLREIFFDEKRQWEDSVERNDLKWANIDLVNHTMMRWVDDGHLTLILLLFHHHPHRSLFCAYIRIGPSDKYAKNITIRSNRASSSSEFCVCVHMYDWFSFVYDQYWQSSYASSICVWLICPIDIDSSKNFINHLRVFTVFIEFLRIARNVFENRGALCSSSIQWLYLSAIERKGSHQIIELSTSIVEEYLTRF